jgi:hypothetical protein
MTPLATAGAEARKTMAPTRERRIRSAVGIAILLLLLARTGPVYAATATVKALKVAGAPGREVIVPIQIQSKDEMGCLQFALQYDPAILEIKSVGPGSLLPDGATVDFNGDQLGWLRAGFVCSVTKKGMVGDGVALNVVFVVKGKLGDKSPLTLQRVRAWEPSDPEILISTEVGEVAVADTFPWLWIAIAGGCLLLGLLLLMLRRRGATVGPAVSSRPAPIATGGARCPKCQTLATAGQRFCGSCGTTLPRVCECGQPIRDGVSFCGGCGRKVS